MNNHSADKCFNRYDERYMGTKPIQQYQNNISVPAALVATSSTITDPVWFADSGASHHATVEPGNLAEAHKYGGKEKLTVGNGNKHLISHVGTNHLSALNNKPLFLNNVLLVPSVKKNNI